MYHFYILIAIQTGQQRQKNQSEKLLNIARKTKGEWELKTLCIEEQRMRASNAKDC